MKRPCKRMQAVLQTITRISALSLGLSFFTVAIKAQDSVIAVLAKQFKEYQEKTLQEKLFVHTDKGFYIAGEILWFKIYDVDASFHLPLDLSRVAYVEILDKNNKPLLQAKISLKNGNGNGSFYLPLNINSGKYKLRAYTNWMKNYSVDYFFEKIITIINTRKREEYQPVTRERKLSIRFFPEGGLLVRNIQSKLAFKATDEKGKGLESFTGLVIDENNDTLLKFSPLKFGMGSFDFTPSGTHHYKAVITCADGRNAIADLPVINQEGYVMHVANETNNQIGVSVSTTNSTTGELYLFVHTGRSVKVVESTRLQNGSLHFVVDRNRLGDGISCFTIFNGNREPLCERLYFKYQDRQLLIKPATDKAEYEERSRISFMINTFNEEGKAQQADLSMSVYRLDSLQTTEDNNISSYLWLSSDLKGAIESPSYYFDQPDKTKEEALDNLLLTQGWRRFRWENVFAHKRTAFAFAPEYLAHIITGRMINIKTGAIVKNVEGYLSIPGTKTQFAVCISDSNGRVKFEMPDMVGSSEIIVQTDPNRDSSNRIEINSPFSDHFSDSTIPDLILNRKYAGSLIDQSISMQAQNIYMGDKFNQHVYTITDTTPFYKTPTTVYLLDNYTRFTTMEEVLREYVANMNVKKRSGGFDLPLLNIPVKERFEQNPLILLDGVPVFDINKLMAYDPLKIRKLEVVNERYLMGNSYFDGIMSFTSYQGNLPGYELDPRAVLIDYAGLQLQREFYSPVYENEQEVSSHLPDFRNLLYWSPNLVTDETGKQNLTLYTSDLPGKYIAVLQGNTADGRCGSQSIIFEVK